LGGDYAGEVSRSEGAESSPAVLAIVLNLNLVNRGNINVSATGGPAATVAAP
jgi:hypothetical protein